MKFLYLYGLTFFPLFCAGMYRPSDVEDPRPTKRMRCFAVELVTTLRNCHLLLPPSEEPEQLVLDSQLPIQAQDVQMADVSEPTISMPEITRPASAPVQSAFVQNAGQIIFQQGLQSA
jgi:hypothetical protein